MNQRQRVNHRRRWRSSKKQKILLLLSAGVALAFTRSPRRALQIIKSVARAWRSIEKQDLYRLVREFREEKLVDFREQADGVIKIVLTEKGKEKILQFDFDRLEIKRPVRWDGKWRVVLSDIPEKKRRARDALRDKLRELGFYVWQKSVFIYPFPCRDEIEFLVEFFEIRSYVRFGELTNPFNEAELKLRFSLT